MKLHFAVRVDTYEVVSMEVSTDDVHDSKEAAGLLKEACSKVNVKKALLDGACDLEEVYQELERRGIEAVVKPRSNARSDTGPISRSVPVGMVRELGYETWVRLWVMDERWAVETAYSTFKRLFGEGAMGRRLSCIALDLAGKVALYNMLVNL